MKKLILFLFMVFFLSSLISGVCNEGQIDINNALLEDMMNIIYLGGEGIVAQQAIDSRPFTSVDDLIKVSGIGNYTLEKIINQSLACVNGFEEEPEETEELVEITQEIMKEYVEEEKEKFSPPLTPEVINLTPKDIKSEEDKKVLDKKEIAKYGFIVFCILIGVLLIFKNKRKYKNEIV